MLRKIIIGMAAACFLALPTLAQEGLSTLTAPIAYAYSDALYALFPGSDTPILVDETPTTDYNAVWSPDGTKLAYTVSADDQPFSMTKTLKVWDRTQTTEIVTGYEPATDSALNWTRDGKLFYIVSTPDYTENGRYLEAYTVDPVAGAVPELVTNQLVVLEGCGGGSGYPMDWLSWTEHGFGARPFAQLTDYGILYPTVCGAGRIGLFRTFSNELTFFNSGELANVVLSADQRSLTGISVSSGDQVAWSLTTVNLETMEETSLTPQNTPLQLAVGSDGSIYYATSSKTGDLLEGLTPEEQGVFASVMGVTADAIADYDLVHNTLTIARVAPDGTETPLVEGFDAYDIGRMAVSGDTLYFSVVTNPEPWLAAILDGSVTNANNFDTGDTYIHTNLYALDLTAPDSEPVLIMEDAAQFAVAGQ